MAKNETAREIGRGGSKFRRPKNAGAAIARVFKYVSEYKVRMVLVIIGIIVSAAANIAGTYLLTPIINNYIIPLIGKQNPDLSGLVRILVLMGGIYLAGVICMYMYQRIMVTVSTGTLLRLREDMFKHMQKLPLKYFDAHTHGEIMSRYTNDIDAMREMLSQGVPQLINSVIRVTGVFIMMIVLSPLLTLLALAMLGIMFLVVKLLMKKSSVFYKRRQKMLGEANGYIEEMIEGQKVVKVFCHEDAVKERFDNINSRLCAAMASADTWASILMPIMNNLGHFHYAATAVVGGVMLTAANPAISIGSLASFLQYTRNFSMPITQLSQQFNSAMSALAGAERIFELIDEECEVDDGSVTLTNVRRGDNGELVETAERTGLWAWNMQEGGNVRLKELKGDVRLENVTFSYDGEKKVLKNVSLYARPGQKIAFVGSTGAGKTTVTNLLNRFYDVQEGEITYDGIPVKQIKKADLRRSLAMVLQDTHLFTGTVMENIRYGRLDATDEEVIAAAKLANADFFITHLPQGYNTLLTSDGANLSQGQRQLLAIARAAVADPPVLILDEATSSIDTRTEALIEKGMDGLMAGRTVFVIAHRLSTVRNANAIMVLENGEIIERGDHDELLRHRGKYYQLYMGMFELS